MKAKIKLLGEIKLKEPVHGDMTLNVFPVNHNSPIQLPGPFALWNAQVNQIFDAIPRQHNAWQHYVTITSKFFTKDDYLRRERVHL